MDASMLLLYSLLFASYSTGIVEETCDTPQYLAVGKSGMIECSFQEGFHTVLWYNSTELAKGKALLQITEGVKEGPGYDSGEYDVCANVSLTINNVTLEHEQNFTVFLIKSRDDDPVSLQVEVIVTVKPSISFPFVDQCGKQNPTCFKQLDFDSKLTCMVQNARPAVPLVWVDRITGNDRNVSFQASVSRNGSVFTTRTTTMQVFPYSSLLSLLSCKADVPPGLLLEKQTTILIENRNLIFTDNIPIVRHLARGSQFLLPCSNKNISLIVWKMASQKNDTFEVLAYAALFEENVVNVCFEQYDLQTNGSLLLPQVEAKHEGFYGCVFENEFSTGGSALYHVVVFSTAIPVVYGCTEDRYCVLEAQTKGSLRCSLKGILPKVGLQWKTFHDRDASLISFTNQKLDVNSNGDVYDVLLTSTYQIQETAKDRVTLECLISETDIKVLQSATKFDLLFTDANTNDESMESVRSFPLWILAIVIPMCLLAILLCLFSIQRARGKIQVSTGLKEAIPMMNYSTEKKNIFISELKAKYKELYNAVQPIPYIRDKFYCVDRVFVEGDIEYLVAKDKIGGRGTWEKLSSSYHNILDDDRVKSTRRILEGEPGYGKSTLTLQLSYDWCNKIQSSYLKDTEILIVLRLRQLGGVMSVYRAIKRFLLPKDSKLTETDVANIIGDCSSVLIILDGYDEYPDKDSDIDSDIISIIMNNMFQQFEVILTTRLSYLPKKYSPLTKRLKLTGFDDNAQDQYIRKAVVGDDVEAADKIKQKLKENPVLSDLCQVPFLFVMLAHMGHESAQFQKCNSVTSFFRYMISCFHSHMKNKMEDANVKKYDLFEADHRELDKLAFEGLSGKDQQIVWNKKDMCERLGKEFYDQYVRIGILVEEEVLDISDDPSLVISEHIQYKTEVRFYHKLFCEWYAAHHLSEYASRDDVIFDPWKEPHQSEQSNSYLNVEQNDTRQEAIESQNDHYLKYVDPVDLQYVYRFTCGLNHIAAEKIIRYLKSIKNARRIAILCIHETSGKVKDVLQDIEDLCSEMVVISTEHSMMLQTSTVELLEIALANKISISCVCLFNCYSKVYLSGGYHLQLKSSLYIPVLTTLNKLWIAEGGKDITEDFTDILQYSSKCLALKELRLYGCLLPQSVQAESVSILRSRKIEVRWSPSDCWYRLNLESRHWEDEDDGRVMTDEDYQSEVQRIRQKRAQKQ